MKTVFMFFGAILAFAPAHCVHADLTGPGLTTDKSVSVTRHGKKHGDFTMLGIGAKNSVYLSNNYYYAPTREKDVKLIAHWRLNDEIRVLKTKDDGRYVLANLRTGESVKTRIYSWK